MQSIHHTQLRFGIPKFSGIQQPHGRPADHRHDCGQSVGGQNYASTYQADTGNYRRGFGVDLDGDGRMTAGQDGVLAFDLNGNGNITKKEIKKSRRRLEYMTGTHPALRSKDRRTRRRANKTRRKLLKKYDRNRDKSLSMAEIQAKGGRVLVDGNNDGRYGMNESQSLSNIRTGGGNFQLNMLDAFGGKASVTSFGQQPSWGRFRG